jgi:ketosteroid isomerase-like protein
MTRNPTLLLVLFLFAVNARAAEPRTPLQERLQISNQTFSEAFVAEDLAAVKSHYADDAVLMPEHGTARYGKEDIEDFYRQWFNGAKIGGLRKTLYETLDFGDYAVETGAFVQTYTKDGDQPYDYSGKYMVLWATDGDQPRIVSELWGANAPFDDKALPVVEDGAPSIDRVFRNDAKIAEEIRGRNAIIGKLVAERKGSEHADLFLPDAIYMTYYMPMLVGIDNIRRYFIEHERPGEVAIDSLALSTGNIYPMDGGNLQLEQGFYVVDWRAGNDSGTVRGKSLNLWKRNQDGTLMLYRQAVNHD